jgi:hypothetical protein
MSDISQYLTPSERILQEWKTGSCDIYATNKRVIIEENGKVSDASYSHISSVEYERHTHVSRIIGAIILIVIGVVMSLSFSSIPILNIGGFLLLLLISIILLLTSSSAKTKMYVVGREPIELSGRMESLLRWVRQYKVEMESKSITYYPTDKTVMPTTPKIEKSESIREGLLKSAMKALEMGDRELARRFLEEARAST